MMLVGWGTAGTPEGNIGPRGAATEHVAYNLAGVYKGLAQLRCDAASVALFRPSGAVMVSAIKRVPFTIATVTVLKTVAGVRLPATCGLRQLRTESRKSWWTSSKIVR